MDTPQIDVVRGLPGVELRADGDTAMPTLFGHFSRFNEWYEIHSYFEGDFIERFAPGAFAESFRMHWDDSDPHKTKVQFQHGYDFSVGERLLGKLSELREDATGGYYEAPLFNTQYNRELVPGLEAGEYGASFRFRVTSESWDMEPGTSDYNPHALPERTITGALVFEVGPVAFGASPTATAGARSMTDDYYEAVRAVSPRQYEDACRAAGKDVATPQRPRNGGQGRRAKRTELKALPDVILATSRGIDLEEITTRRRGQELIEARRLSPNLKVDQTDDAVVVSGYVMVYDEPRSVAGEAGWTEIWAPGACSRSVGRSPDVRLTLNGEGEPLARSKAGTLELTSDDYGLHITATIDPSTPQGEDISLALQRNEPVDALVGHDVVRQRWNDDHTHRTVEEVYLHDIALLIDGCAPRADADLARLHLEPEEPEVRVSLDYLLMVNATLEA
jgi:HK97 family phage prohead protease